MHFQQIIIICYPYTRNIPGVIEVAFNYQSNHSIISWLIIIIMQKEV